MNFNIDNSLPNVYGSQKWSDSQNSSGLGDIDELLDLNQPPSIESFTCPSPQTGYPSQLILPRSTQTSSNLDSGLDFTPKQSFQSWSWNKSQLHSQFQFLDTERGISSQSTVSINSDSINSLNDTQSTTGFDTDEKTNIELEELEETFSKCCSQERFSQNTPSQNVQQYEQSYGQNLAQIEQNDTQNSVLVQAIESNISNESENMSDSETICEEQSTASNDYENRNADDSDVGQPLESAESNSASSFDPEIGSILNLYTHIKSQYSDCAFVYALAAQMCKDIYPKHSHISLKTALLLSIVSCNSQNNAQPISIMAITRDSAAASTIMRHIGNYAKRFISISDDLKFSDKRSQSKCIEANSLLMARNGVCYVGDWLGLKPASLKYLQNVIDSGRVTVETTANIEFPLNCSIWMYWTCAAKKMSQNQTDLSSISKLFGIPIVLDETPSQDVINFLFAQCTGNQTELEMNDVFEIDDNAIKTYLSFVSGIPTEFDSEAMSMLKYYFIVTRAIRPNILTPKSFDILQCLSECHAKLCLRTDVSRIDVIFAIELFEQFVLNVFAGEVITKPMPNALITNFEQVDEHMHEFEQWLNGYLANFNQNVNTFFQES